MRKMEPIKLVNSEQKSYSYFRHARWGGKRRCPRCSYKYLYYLNGRYACKRCRYKFDDFTGTYLGKLRIAMHILAYLLHLFALGVPAYRIRFYAPVSLATIEHVFWIFREAIYDASLEEMEELKLSGKLEMDEVLFGGHRKGKRGWGAEGKTMVFGIYQRNGMVVTFPVPDRKYDTLMPLIEKHTRKGSLYYTDDHTAYASLKLRGKHKVIAHGMEEYVKKDAHINGIEGFWSYAKVWLYHYRGVPKQYFHLYLKEVEFRFNNREMDLFDKLVKLLVKSVPNV
jgi:transposase